MRERDDVNVVGEAVDVPGYAVKLADVVAGLDSFPCVQERRIDESDVASGGCGVFLEQLPSRRKRRVHGDHTRHAAAVRNGALDRWSVDANDGSLELLREAFR